MIVTYDPGKETQYIELQREEQYMEQIQGQYKR